MTDVQNLPGTVRAKAPSTFWKGLPCEATRGTAVVRERASAVLEPVTGESAAAPGERVPVVRVRYHGETRYLLDTQGRGWAKVTVGLGSPAYVHYDLDVEDFRVGDDHEPG